MRLVGLLGSRGLAVRSGGLSLGDGGVLVRLALLVGLLIGLLVELLLGLVLPLCRLVLPLLFLVRRGGALRGLRVERGGLVSGHLRGGLVRGQRPGVPRILRVCGLGGPGQDGFGLGGICSVGLRKVLVTGPARGLAQGLARRFTARGRRARRPLAGSGLGADTGVTAVCCPAGLSGPVGLRVRLVVAAHMCSSSGLAPCPGQQVANIRALCRFRLLPEALLWIV